jgi:hypothetical protein
LQAKRKKKCWKFKEETEAETGATRFSVRFEVFTAVAMKNGVLWDVTPCGSCKNRSFGGT